MNRQNCANQEQLLEIINNFKTKKSLLEINVMFVNSNFNRNQKYKVYTLGTKEKDILPTIEYSIKYLEEEIAKRSFEKYDLELSMDETVQTVDDDKVINGKVLLETATESKIDDKWMLDEKVNLDSLDFIIFQLYDSSNGKSIYFFQKYVHPTSKYKKTLKYTLNGREAVPFKKDIITLNPIVDAILYEKHYYIFNRKNFNTIFNFKDVFYKIINENKESIKESKLFVKADDFIEDCIQDGRFLPRLTKVILAKGFDTVNSNKKKLPALKEQYNLSFQLTKDGKIAYNDKKQITDIINVLLDHFVISALTDKRMLAKAIEKYEI